jgi:copper homeostasis protein
MSQRPLIEICLDRMDSIRHCAAAGIDRIELCHALSEGGLTPSQGMIAMARQIFSGTIMVMIRPRRGDFFYSAEEIEVMCKDIVCARENGVDGVVFGCLMTDGSIDERATTRLLEVAQGLDITFHRAFDVTPDLHKSLGTLIRLGIPRVLTSGGQPDVWQGAKTLAALHQQAAGRITLLPGGGLTAARAAEFLQRLPVTEIHLSARKTTPSVMTYQRDDMPMGTTSCQPEMIHYAADPNALAALRHLSLI